MSASANLHISYLDSIRGLAALTVITEHYVIAYGLPCQNFFCQALLDSSPFNFWWNGSAAVSMFFVLSGFVLSLKYFRHDSQLPSMAGFNLGQFMVARIMRIWLPYLAVLLISGGFYSYQVSQDFPLTLLSSSAWVQQMWHGHPLTALDMLRESFLLNLPSQVVLLPQAWTLSIELVLSLMLPVALLLLSRNIVWLVLFSFYAVMFLGVSAFLLHFVMGLILARYYGLISMYLLTRPVWRFATLLLGFALYSSANVWKDWLTENQLWLLTGVGASLILMYVFGSSLMQRSLSHPFLRQIGKVSYSAYLIHMLVLICITPLLLKTLELFSQNRLSLWLGGYFLSLLVVHGLSLWFYQKLEMPSISFGRRIGAVLNKD